ncbi:MAG: NAD(+) diphosphatase [Burkholderiales bacterium]|nr:NAD(+) diphosphatase [Burkholderiales bacterium]
MPFAAPADYVPGVAPPAVPQPDALWFLFRDSRLLAGEGTMRLPPGALAAGLNAGRPQYLGTLAGREVYAAEAASGADAPAGYRWSDLRSLFSRMDDTLVALAGRALQLVDWDRTHRFCGRCATPTLAKDAERSRECPACGLVAYPRIAPAVMALVKRDPGEILLARSPRFPPGMYSALAGFVEPGETLEQCLEREVLEEVGVRVANVRYFASQPWPFPNSLMIAFVADWAGGEIRPDPLEIEAAQWFIIADLPQLPQPISIARRLIDAVVGEMRAAAGQ